jgi:hypothetical protein
MPCSCSLRFSAVIAAAAISAPALGQTPEAKQAAAEAPVATQPSPAAGGEGGAGAGNGEWKLSFSPRGEYAFSADLRSSGSRVSVGRAGLSLDASGPLGDRAKLLLNADVEASFYRFKDVAAPLPFTGSAPEPLRDAYTIRLRPGVSYRVDETWSVLGGAIVEFAGEGGADVGKSVTFGGYGGATYRASADLSLTLGVIVKSRLEDDALIVPLLGVRWAIDERWTLATEGLGARLSAKMSEEVTVSVFGRYEIRDFRLDDDAALPKGIVQDTRLPTGVGIEWTPTPRLSVGVSGGVVVGQKYKFLNENGDELAGDRTKVAPFVGIRGEWRF